MPPSTPPIVVSQSKFYRSVLVALIVGFVLGGVFTAYLALKNIRALSVPVQPPTISGAVVPSQLSQANSATLTTQYFGKVVSTGANQFTLQLTIANPLDSKSSTTTTQLLAFNPSTDTVYGIKKTVSKTSTAVEQVKETFADIKVGEFVLVKVLQGVKTVYLPAR